MAAFTGIGGSVTFSATAFTSAATLCVQSYTVSINTDNEEFICLSGSGWKESIAGAKSWSATVEASYDATQGVDLANTIGKSVTCTFETGTGGLAFSGTGVITSISVNVNSTRNTCSFSVTGNGALSEA